MSLKCIKALVQSQFNLRFFGKWNAPHIMCYNLTFLPHTHTHWHTSWAYRAAPEAAACGILSPLAINHVLFLQLALPHNKLRAFHCLNLPAKTVGTLAGLRPRTPTHWERESKTEWVRRGRGDLVERTKFVCLFNCFNVLLLIKFPLCLIGSHFKTVCTTCHLPLSVSNGCCHLPLAACLVLLWPCHLQGVPLLLLPVWPSKLCRLMVFCVLLFVVPLTFCDVSASGGGCSCSCSRSRCSCCFAFNVTHVTNLCVCVEGHRLNLQWIPPPLLSLPKLSFSLRPNGKHKRHTHIKGAALSACVCVSARSVTSWY